MKYFAEVGTILEGGSYLGMKEGKETNICYVHFRLTYLWTSPAGNQELKRLSDHIMTWHRIRMLWVKR